MKRYIEYIRNVSLFQSIEDKELEILASLLEKREYQAEETVVKANEPGNALFIIVEGRAIVVLKDEDGTEIFLDELGPGRFFGEISLIDGMSRSADVISLTPLSVLRLGRDDFQNVVHQHPSLMYEMLQELCHRLRYANDRIKGVNISQMYIY